MSTLKVIRPSKSRSISGKTKPILIILFMLFGYNLSFAQAGNLDTSFDPGTGANNEVYTASIQSDGKIIIGGQFTSYNGTARNRIARLNADGSLDNSFDPGTGANSNWVFTTSIQSDGKIIIGGLFTSYNGTARNRIARLNADGSLDTSFDPGMGASGPVWPTSVQSDGKIVIGGGFISYNGTARSKIARLNVDGSLDNSFDPGTGANNEVYTTSIQSDGKIIIGGNFTSYDGTTTNYIARLNTDGSLDTTFEPGTGAGNLVRTSSIQSDGKIIIGGDFTSYNGTAINRIARLNVDGSLDTFFDPGTGANGSVNPSVETTSIQSDGKIVIGGRFTSFNGTAVNRIARLNVNGKLDTSFKVGTGANDWVWITSIQSDGKIIIGGDFTSYNGTARNCIARLESTTTGIHQLVNAIRRVYVFPNPFSNATKLHSEVQLKNAVLTVYNLSGQSVKQISPINIGAGHAFHLNRNNLPGGLYYIHVLQDDQIIMTDKLVIAD